MYTSRYPSRKFYLKFFGGRLAITPKAFASLRFRGALSGNAQRVCLPSAPQSAKECDVGVPHFFGRLVDACADGKT